jgi:general stress protein YciG
MNRPVFGQFLIFFAIIGQHGFNNTGAASSGGIMAEKEEKKGSMTVREAGHKGGEKTAETHGKEFYQQIGHKGGEKVAEEKGPGFYSRIGHKGGEKVRELVRKGEEK